MDCRYLWRQFEDSTPAQRLPAAVDNVSPDLTTLIEAGNHSAFLECYSIMPLLLALNNPHLLREKVFSSHVWFFGALVFG